MTLFELMAKIGLDSSEFDEGIEDARDKTESFSDSIGSKLVGSVAKATAAIAALKTVIEGLKAVVNAYADYEQLVGDAVWRERGYSAGLCRAGVQDRGAVRERVHADGDGICGIADQQPVQGDKRGG